MQQLISWSTLFLEIDVWAVFRIQAYPEIKKSMLYLSENQKPMAQIHLRNRLPLLVKSSTQ